jgi:hypothetical protein
MLVKVALVALLLTSSVIRVRITSKRCEPPG